MAKKIGFQALRRDVFAVDPDQLVITDDPEHPLYDPHRRALPLDENMLASIDEFGILQPIVVAEEGKHPVVVAGRRRVLHAREVKQRRAKRKDKTPILVPCMIRVGANSQLVRMAVIENEHRTADTPLSRAEKAAKMLGDGCSCTIEQVASAFGVTPQAVYHWLKLLKCAAPVKQAVQQGKLTAAAAEQLSGLSSEEQKEKLSTLLENAPATAPKNGHAKRGHSEQETPTRKRPTAQDAAEAAGKEVIKLRTKREILERLETPKLPRDYKAALQWVLRMED